MPLWPGVHWWAGQVRLGVPAGAQSPCAPALLLPCTEARPCQGSHGAGPSAGAVPNAAHQPATCALARLAAGHELTLTLAYACGAPSCRPAARCGGHRVRRQHRAGQPAGAQARERAHARGGAHWRHALPVYHAAVVAAAHRRAGARARGARPCRQQRRASVAHALALAASSVQLHAWAGPASSTAAMCLQASHHHRPAHLHASCHAYARGSLALIASIMLQGPGLCRPAHHWVGWQVIWQATLAPGPCRPPHPTARLPRAERGRGERAVAGVAEHHV